jgi:hypothetical protein
VTLLEQLEQTPPAAKMVLPAAVMALVSRQKHPIVWWVFGVFPMASAVAQAITEGRLFGPPKDPLPTASRAPALVSFPGSTLPSQPDWINPDGSPGYLLR